MNKNKNQLARDFAEKTKKYLRNLPKEDVVSMCISYFLGMHELMYFDTMNVEYRKKLVKQCHGAADSLIRHVMGDAIEN